MVRMRMQFPVHTNRKIKCLAFVDQTDPDYISRVDEFEHRRSKTEPAIWEETLLFGVPGIIMLAMIFLLVYLKRSNAAFCVNNSYR